MISLPPNRMLVRGEGPADAEIVLLGEQPGRVEVMTGKPFCGPSGSLLDECAGHAQLNRRACYVTNVIKDLDKPIDKYISLSSNRQAVVSSDGALYLEFLGEELSKIKPKLIVAMGRVALFALTGETIISHWRGSVLKDKYTGALVVPTYHPAFCLPPKGEYINKHLIVHDLRKAVAIMNGGPPLIHDVNGEISPSYASAMQFLYQLIADKPKIIDFDIEVVRRDVSCLAIAYETKGMCIPFIDSYGHFYSCEEETNIMRLIGTILEDTSIGKRGQNISFDSQVMLKKFGICMQGDIHDTMVAQKIIMPDFPAGLDFIASIHTNIPYYKGEGKTYFKIGGSYNQFWQYNLMDAIATKMAWPHIESMLLKQNNMATYNRQRSIISPLVYMMTKGIKVDVAGLVEGRTKLTDELQEKDSAFKAKVGFDLNYNSPKQLIEYFYNKLGFSPYTKRDSEGKYVPTVDSDALKRLARKGVSQASDVLKLRKISKTLSVYMNLDKIDDDGRYRSSYNPGGTVTGRLSSSKNIWGTGGNQQNWPHELLKYLVPDTDYIYYSLDLSQIENRIVAYVGRIPSMIFAFETGLDVHRLTASLILGIPIAEVSDEEGSCNLGDGTHSQRDWGKKANHALNYDLKYRKFALLYEMMESQAKWMVEKYHKAYPEVRMVYHQGIRNQLTRDRTITNLMGRRRVFMDQWSDDLLRQAYAQIPQSTTADKINEHGLIHIYNNYPEVELLNQVHDSVGFQIHKNVPWIRQAKILMSIRDSLETPLVYHERSFTVPADILMGLSLYKKQGIEFKHGKYPTDLEEFSKLLESSYAKLVTNHGAKA